MRTFTTLVTLVALAAPAAVLAAQDAATYALNAEERFEAGDVFTETVEESKEQKVVVSVGGQVVQDQGESSKVSYVSVTKVLAVDDNGAPTKLQTYFTTFTFTEAGFDDDTLKGKVVEITTAVDGTTQWRHHAGEGNIASSARKWLDEQMAGALKSDAEDAAGRALTPKTPVKVGDSWTPDLAVLMKSLEMGDDTSKAKGSCKLEKIETRGGVEIAHITMKAEMPMTAFPGMEGMEVKWTKGGTMTFSHTGTTPTSARIAPGEDKSTYALEGEADMQGASVALTVKGSESTITTLEGAIPDLPLIPVKPVTPEGEGDSDGDKK
jgi:hypothetical protein